MASILFRKTLAFIIIILFIGLSINSSIGSITTKNVAKDNSSSQTYFSDLKVYYIDVGQGDSILIQTPENNFVLIDTGEREYAYTVIDFLNSLSVFTITAFVATHPHSDHIGGAEEIFDAFDIQSVYHPGYYSSSQTYQRFLNAAENEGCPIYTDDDVDPGDYIYIGGSVSCQILSINKDAPNANDASIVLRLDYYQISYLFTGDIAEEVEYYLVDNWNVNIDILKVAHHGSRYGSTDYFLYEATPDVSVISVGEGNSYGHPHPETLYRLSQHNSLIFRTDQNGDVTVTTDGTSWNVFYERPEDKPLRPVVNGPTEGITGIEYMFSARTVDPNGDQLYYQWNWGDGNISDWMGLYNSGQEVYAYHKWTEDGFYTITVKGKDIHGHESDLGTLNVIMPRNRVINSPLLKLLQNILQRFPILQQLLKL